MPKRDRVQVDLTLQEATALLGAIELGFLDIEDARGSEGEAVPDRLIRAVEKFRTAHQKTKDRIEERKGSHA